MKKEFAKRFKLNWYDYSKAIGLFFITTLGDLLVQGLAMWQADHSKPIDWKEMLITAAIATVSYLIKNYFTTVPKEAVEKAAKDQGIYLK